MKKVVNPKGLKKAGKKGAGAKVGETAAATATALQLGLLAREDFLASAITFSLQCDFVVLVWP